MPIAPERIRAVFAKLERDLLKLSTERRPERVHSFRTGTRRLQTLLEDLLPDRDRNQKKLLKLLLRVRKRAGRAPRLRSRWCCWSALCCLFAPCATW